MLKRGSIIGAVVILIWLIVRGSQSPRRLSVPRTPMVEVLEPLETDVLVRRSLETFPSGYLNNISIIQGVALSSLAVQTFGILLHPAGTQAVALYKVMVIAEALFLLAGIIVVAYEYLWFLTVMRWTPTFRDTLVPIGLGVSEIVPQFFLGEAVAWWFSVSFFTFVGSLAFGNTINRLEPGLFGKYSEAYEVTRKVLWKLAGCCVFLTLVEVGMALFVKCHPHTGLLAPFIVMCFLMVSTAVVVFLSERALDRVYRYLNVDRRPKRRPAKRPRSSI